MRNGLKTTIVITTIASVNIFWGCSKVPVTGRSQLSMVSNTDIIGLSTLQYQEVLETSKLSNDQEQVQLVKTVGNRIKTAVEKYMNDNGYGSSLEGFSWEFNLIADDATVNAWAMP